MKYELVSTGFSANLVVDDEDVRNTGITSGQMQDIMHMINEHYAERTGRRLRSIDDGKKSNLTLKILPNDLDDKNSDVRKVAKILSKCLDIYADIFKRQGGFISHSVFICVLSTCVDDIIKYVCEDNDDVIKSVVLAFGKQATA